MRVFRVEIPNLKIRMALPTITPAFVATLSFIVGVGLAVAGVYVLAGAGWALIAGSIPPLALAGVLMRGLLHVVG